MRKDLRLNRPFSLLLLVFLAFSLASCEQIPQLWPQPTPVSMQPVVGRPGEVGQLPIPATALPDPVTPEAPPLPAPTAGEGEMSPSAAPLETAVPALDPAATSLDPNLAETLEVLPPQLVPQPGTPVLVPNFTRPAAGCSWAGVGGQIFDTNREPMLSLLVELGGSLGGRTVSELTLTGSALAYGPGGYEFTLASQPVESNQTLWLQVHNLQGQVLSDRHYFSTSADCTRNAVLFNFMRQETGSMYLPVLLSGAQIGR
jgi:hypothetical protein